jgi:hypothetical protein
MKITKSQIRKIVSESEQSRGDRLVSHMVDALVAHLRSEDMLLSTDEVTDWLLGEFKLSQPGSPVPHGLIDRVLNDVRLDDLYEPRDDAWGESEVPYAGPGDGSLTRGLTKFAEGRSQEITKRQLKRIIKEYAVERPGDGLNHNAVAAEFASLIDELGSDRFAKALVRAFGDLERADDTVSYIRRVG